MGSQRSIRRVSGMCRVLLSSSLLYRLVIYWLGVDGVVTPRCTIGIQTFDFFVTDWRTRIVELPLRSHSVSFVCRLARSSLRLGQKKP